MTHCRVLKNQTHTVPIFSDQRRGNLQKLTGSDPPSQLGAILASAGHEAPLTFGLSALVGGAAQRDKKNVSSAPLGRQNRGASTLSEGATEPLDGRSRRSDH